MSKQERPGGADSSPLLPEDGPAPGDEQDVVDDDVVEVIAEPVSDDEASGTNDPIPEEDDGYTPESVE